MPVTALPAFLIVGVLTVAGLGGVVRTSLRQGLLGEAGIGLAAWRRVLGDPTFRDAVGFTVWVAAASTVVAVVGAIAVASSMRRSHRGRRALAVPVAAPHLVVATLAVVWLAPGGMADRLHATLPVGLVGNGAGWGVIVVYAAKEVPFLTLLALAALDDATVELEETAALLGANRWQRLRDVILPRLAVPMVAGGLVVAAFVIGAVEVPLLVGPTRPEMLGPYALEVVRLDGPVARADAAVAELAASAIVGALGAAAGVAWRQMRRRRLRRSGWPRSRWGR
ncbi:MAG: ABC transporter permease subunit [Acidimicrobiales bacterium]